MAEKKVTPTRSDFPTKLCDAEPGKLRKNKVGRISAKFKDCLGEDALIGEDQPTRTIWLGNWHGHHDEKDWNVKCIALMYLDRRLAKWLWPMLKTFAETGRLK